MRLEFSLDYRLGQHGPYGLLLCTGAEVGPMTCCSNLHWRASSEPTEAGNALEFVNCDTSNAVIRSGMRSTSRAFPNVSAILHD